MINPDLSRDTGHARDSSRDIERVVHELVDVDFEINSQESRVGNYFGILKTTEEFQAMMNFIRYNQPWQIKANESAINFFL